MQAQGQGLTDWVGANNKTEPHVLNASPEAVNLAAVKTASARIIQLLREGKLEPTRVMIFKEHPIVKEAIAVKTIEVPLPDDPAKTLWVPLSQNGKRIIVKKFTSSGETYALFSLPPDAGVDLRSCLKR